MHQIRGLVHPQRELLRNGVLEQVTHAHEPQDVEENDLNRQERQDEGGAQSLALADRVPDPQTEEAREQADVLEVREQLEVRGVDANQPELEKKPNPGSQSDPHR